MQPYRPSCGSTISVQIQFAPLSSSTTRKATSAVQMNDSMGEWFRTTVGERQWCFSVIHPLPLQVFGWTMFHALEEHEKGSTGGRYITNVQFADDIDALIEEEQELEALAESLDHICTRYKTEISAEKTKQMTNNAYGIQKEIKVKG